MPYAPLSSRKSPISRRTAVRAGVAASAAVTVGAVSAAHGAAQEATPPALGAVTQHLEVDVVVANPVTDSHGGRAGTVFEWTDRKQEVGVEGEMQTMLSDGCVTCFDDAVQCTAQHCLSMCLQDANGQPCKDCRAMCCDPAFVTCSGLPAN